MKEMYIYLDPTQDLVAVGREATREAIDEFWAAYERAAEIVARNRDITIHVTGDMSQADDGEEANAIWQEIHDLIIDTPDGWEVIGE